MHRDGLVGRFDIGAVPEYSTDVGVREYGQRTEVEGERELRAKCQYRNKQRPKFGKCARVRAGHVKARGAGYRTTATPVGRGNRVVGRIQYPEDLWTTSQKRPPDPQGSAQENRPRKKPTT